MLGGKLDHSLLGDRRTEGMTSQAPSSNGDGETGPGMPPSLCPHFPKRPLCNYG